MYRFADPKLFISYILEYKTILKKNFQKLSWKISKLSFQCATFAGKWEWSHPINDMANMPNRKKWAEFYHMNTFGQFFFSLGSFYANSYGF